MTDTEKKEEVEKAEGKEAILFFLGAVLTTLVLVWGSPPSRGEILTASILLLLAFVCFLNSYYCIARANYYLKNKNTGKAKILDYRILFYRTVNVAEILQGLGFAFIIIVFSILGYKYLMDLTSVKLFSLLIPIIFISSLHILSNVIIPSLINNKITFTGRIFYLLVELPFLVLIILDYFEIIVIP